jgi:hypothetical protein
MALKGFGLGGNLIQGVLGNLSEVSTEQLAKEYSGYLMDDEEISMGFKLVRDAVVFTDKRILFFDKQGATGSKNRVTSINLETIVSVTAETAGFGIDDSEITITYISSPNLRSNNIALDSHKLEFPKKYAIQPLYKMLQELAYQNFKNINR